MVAFEDILSAVRLLVFVLHPRETETTCVHFECEILGRPPFLFDHFEDVMACEVRLWEKGLTHV